MRLDEHIRQIPDFPKPGILFYDISTLLLRPEAFAVAIDRMAEAIRPFRPEILAAIESRGFLFAAPIALRLGIGCAMVRKRGKLPGSVVRHAYDLEYGSDTVEASADLLVAGTRAVVVDDLIATGGTAAATVELLGKIGVEVAAAAFLIELTMLGGRKRLDVPVEALLSFEG
jgi:adenine phosphoribosyltransferase